MNLDVMLAEVARMRVRADEAERQAREVAKGLAALQGQVEAAIARTTQDSTPP